jgi:hypothetical protein
MWLFSGVPEDSEDNTVMEEHSADALFSAANTLIYAIQTADHDAQHYGTLWMIQIAKPWTIRWW